MDGNVSGLWILGNARCAGGDALCTGGTAVVPAAHRVRIRTTRQEMDRLRGDPLAEPIMDAAPRVERDEERVLP